MLKIFKRLTWLNHNDERTREAHYPRNRCDFGSTISGDPIDGHQYDVCQPSSIVNSIWLLTDETGAPPRWPPRKQREFSAKAVNFGANVSCDFFVIGNQKRYLNYLFCSDAARSYYYIAQMDKSRSLARKEGYIVSGGAKRRQSFDSPRQSNDNPTDFQQLHGNLFAFSCKYLPRYQPGT
jgi:hypothetical protein